MDLFKGDKSPSSEALLLVDARERNVSRTRSNLDNWERPCPVSKMASARRVVLVLSLCLLVILGAASTGPARLHCREKVAEQQAIAEAASTGSSFSDLLRSASPAALDELLHRYLPSRFQDGVWPSEHGAIEAVHQEDPALANSILQLAKRDGSNNSTTASSSSTSTTTSSPTSSSSVTPSSTSASSTSLSSASPTSTSTTAPSTSSSTSSSSSTPASPSSSSTPGTSSSPSETTHPPTSSGSGTSSSSSHSISPSSTLLSSSSPRGTTLTTSATPSTPTSSPPHTSKQVIQTFTSTSNGELVTLTSTTYVSAEGGATSTPASTGPAASLQNAAPRQRYGSSLLAGMMAAAMAWLLV